MFDVLTNLFSILGLAIGMAIVVWGWKVFRYLVALVSGLWAGSLGAAVCVAALVKNSSSSQMGDFTQVIVAVGGAAFVGFAVSFVIGALLGYYLQRFVAGVSFGLFGANLVGLVVAFGMDAGRGPAAIAGLVALVVIFIAVWKFYDYAAAALSTLLVASAFNTFRFSWGAATSPGLSAIQRDIEKLTGHNPHGQPSALESVVTLLTGFATELVRSIWTYVLITVWMVVAAVLLRAIAWRRQPDVPSMRWDVHPRWGVALFMTAALVLANEVLRRSLEVGDLGGFYPAAWPVIAAATVVYLESGVGSRQIAGSAWKRWLVDIAFGGIVFPGASAVALFIFVDVPRLFLAPEAPWAATGFVSNYYVGLVWPPVLRGDADLGFSTTILLLIAKWQFLLAPAALLGWARKRLADVAFAAPRAAVLAWVGRQTLEARPSPQAMAPMVEAPVVISAGASASTPATVDLRKFALIGVGVLVAVGLLVAGLGRSSAVSGQSDSGVASPAEKGAGTAVAAQPSSPSALSSEDQSFVDTRGGAGWGDRCFAHINAGRLENARAACERGVAMNPSAQTRGALLFNLGLIAEKSGDIAEARRAYEESLSARPGNPTVKKALADLGPEPTPGEVPSAGTSSDRHTRQDCGSIVDSTTKLEWFVGPDRDTTWNDASTWAASLKTCGNGWRLPKSDELAHLYDASQKAGTGFTFEGKTFVAKIDPIFSGIGGGAWVWTSKEANATQAVTQNLYINQPVTIGKDLSGGKVPFAARAFAVRSTNGGGGAKSLRGSMKSFAASSVMSNATEQHPPEDAFDDNPKTAWSEDVPGSGKGEWVEATFASAVTIDAIEMAAGFDYVSPKFGDLFSANAHLRRVRIEFSEGEPIEQDIAETSRQIRIQAGGRRTTRIRIVAAEVYDGKRWQDLCLSEIRALGQPEP